LTKKIVSAYSDYKQNELQIRISWQIGHIFKTNLEYGSGDWVGTSDGNQR
jgi:hypothetical protein